MYAYVYIVYIFDITIIYTTARMHYNGPLYMVMSNYHNINCIRV